MARHDIPDDGTKHIAGPECPCKPDGRKRLDRGVMRTVYAHREAPPRAAVALLEHTDVEFPEADCGHIVIDVDGDAQHHNIPDDGAPHAPTTECGCGVQRVEEAGHVVFEHVDQERSDGTE